MPAFLNPLMLWGLGAAAVPIAIHLLHRRRFQRQRWAAMEWLLLAANQNKKRLQMENLLLLLARTCAVLFLALALTRPSFSEVPALLGAQQKTHLYVLLDNSASMSARSGTRSAFDEALGAVASQIAQLADDDPVSLVLTNDVWGEGRHSGRPRMILKDVRDHSAVRRRLGEMKTAATRADLADALRTLDEAVPSTGTMRRRVAIISDFQAVTVEGSGAGGAPDEAKADAVRSVIERLHGKGAEVLPIQVGREVANVAITDLRPAEDRDVVQGATAIFHAEIRNYSDRAQRVEVKFRVDGREIGDSTQIVEMPARAAGTAPAPSATAQFWTVFTDKDVGVHVITATIQTDAMPLDDSRGLAFSVRPQVRVLLVDGEPSGGPNRESEVQWLRSAIGIQEESGPFSPSVMTEERFHGLSNYDAWDVLVLANVRTPAPSPEARTRLEEYVRKGGALFLTVGANVAPAVWNEAIYSRATPPVPPGPGTAGQPAREGGLLPAKLGAARIDPKATLRFDLSANRHPILSDITNPANAAFFESPILSGYMTVEGAEAERGTRAVMHFTDLARTPVLLEKRFGKGAVVLYLSTIDDDWGRLLGSYLFPVFVHESLHHLTSRGNAERNVLCFQPWSRPVPPNLLSFEVTKPDGSTPRLDRDVGGDGANVTFSDTEQPGIYTAKLELKPVEVLAQAPPPVRDAFAVNLTPLESDLRRVEQDVLMRRWAGLVATSEKAAVDASSARARAGEIAIPLIIAAIACLLFEILLVQRIGRQRR